MIDEKKIDNTNKILAELQRKQLQFVAEGGQVIRTEAHVRCPKKDGNLARSIQTRAFTQGGVAISETEPTAEYAVFVERGTGIYAQNGLGRKTPWWYQTPDGQWFFTHGMKAQPYMEPGYQAAKERFPGMIQRIMKV